MLNIIIPIAGSSKDFINAGYFYPKPIIEIKGKPMIQWVTEPLSTITITFELIFIIKEEDAIKFHLDNTLKILHPKSQIIQLKKETKGALCSVLMAIDKINLEYPLLILNSDQILNVDFQKILNYWEHDQVEAGVVTFPSIHPRWSYVLIHQDKIIQTAEKNPISNMAIAGYYYFNNSDKFFKNAFNSILKDDNVNGNFYISSVLNEYILNNQKVSFWEIENNEYTSFYSPKLISEFENQIK
jgi:dTDP-glucose pyrophosphorylase